MTNPTRQVMSNAPWQETEISVCSWSPKNLTSHELFGLTGLTKCTVPETVQQAMLPGCTDLNFTFIGLTDLASETDYKSTTPMGSSFEPNFASSISGLEL
ncbi:hypothetical protein MKW98_015126 [Papaver atlanticum]|uniref:Uncharacterized protein n=1 Tax=Papaver atlanticum TaxID=357466 RepID=A0AAD4S745_9MAGN|nr:hypothetical protein MKW98_015126 [Papaver atlanticum]